MRIYRDRIEVERGETWTYDVDIVNNDGSPFVISNKFVNPYFLLTVSYTKYSMHGRYLKNYWCPVDDTYLRFYVTTPIELANQTMSPSQALTGALLEQYTRHINGGGTESNFAIYKINGNYYYWNGTSYEEYITPFTITFPYSDTITWIEQEYEFAMKFVDGNLPDSGSDKPIKNFNHVQPITVPSKIVVSSNISESLEEING